MDILERIIIREDVEKDHMLATTNGQKNGEKNNHLFYTIIKFNLFIPINRN